MQTQAIGQTGCVRATLAVALLCAVPDIATADSAPALDAALRACTEPESSIETRLQDLATAGWRTEGDTQTARDLHALVSLARFPKSFSGDRQDETARFAETRAADLALDFSPGLALKVDDLFPSSSDAKLAEADLAVNELIATLHLRDIVRREDPNAAGLVCKLGSGPPIDVNEMPGLLDTDGAEIEVSDSPFQLPAPPKRNYRVRNAGRAYGIDLIHINLTPRPGLNDIAAVAGSDIVLSTIVETTLSPVPLR